MRRYEFWQAEYRKHRYASTLSQEELDLRIRDLILNLTELGVNAKIGPSPFEGPEGYPPQVGELWQQWSHAIEELAIRHGPWPAGMKPGGPLQTEPFPDFVGERAKKAAKAVRRITESRGKIGEVFVKLGSAKHMESLVRYGQLRVQPASFYARSDHTGAIRDDELSLLLSLSLPRDLVVKFVRNPQDVPIELPDHRLNIHLKSRGDFWMYCLAKSLKPRLFVDFESDACVVIHDRKRFSKLLKDASTVHFPECRFRNESVNYVDPLRPKNIRIDLEVSKHFSYTYQDEFRFIWSPIRPPLSFHHMDLTLGSLESMAELVFLDE